MSTPVTDSPNLNTPDVVKNLEDVLSTAFMNAFKSTPTWWRKIAMTQDFDAAGLVLAWLGEVEDLREWVGDRQIGELDVYGYRIAPKDFERTKGLNVNDITDSVVANMANIFRAIGEAAARHPQVLIKDLLRKAHLATSLCYDGVPFLSTAHPYKRADGTAGTYPNYIPQAGATKRFYLIRGDGNGETSFVKPFVFGTRIGQGYDFKTHGGPASTMEFMKKKIAFGVDARVAAAYGLPQFISCSEKQLSREALEELDSLMSNIPGDRGVEIENSPNLLVVDQDDKFLAEELVKTKVVDGTDNIHGGRYEVLVIKGLKGEASILPGA